MPYFLLIITTAATTTTTTYGDNPDYLIGRTRAIR
jgi:hypothetical protein